VDAAHERLAERIRTLAVLRGIPLSHVADRATVGRAHLYDILAGRASPSLTWIVKIAAVLEVEPWELLAPTVDGKPSG
jgi:transcriptional regulator with XRE-family HTH domain